MQLWPWRYVGQGQPRIIIWTKLVGPTSPMLHTKSQGLQPSGSGEEDFKGFLPYKGVVAILVMWPGPFEQTFAPILRSLHMKYEFNWPSNFREEDVRKCWQTTNGRTSDAGVIGILLAHQWAFGSGELMSRWQKSRLAVNGLSLREFQTCKREFVNLKYFLNIIPRPQHWNRMILVNMIY